MSLTMIITQAGLDAITAADGLGLLPLEITEIAIGDAHWTPTIAATALQNETKRLPVTGGSVVADNYLSAKAIDQSADVYNVGEVGLYTDGGVLMAIYSQPTDITAKATASSTLFQIDAEFTSVAPGSLTVGDIGFDNPPATTEVLGVVELATQAEMDAGTGLARVPPVKVVADYIAYIVGQLAQVPTGAVFYVPATTAPAGTIKLNGATLNRTDFPELWAFAQSSGNLVAQASKDTGNFGDGDGATTFSLPDGRSEHIRGWDDGRGVDPVRAIGSYQGATHITGDNGLDAQVQGIAVLGASNVDAPDGTARSIYHTDPSTTTSTASAMFWGAVRGRNIALLACIKY
jgi:phage-related tail fiber protein